MALPRPEAMHALATRELNPLLIQARRRPSLYGRAMRHVPHRRGSAEQNAKTPLQSLFRLVSAAGSPSPHAGSPGACPWVGLATQKSSWP